MYITVCIYMYITVCIYPIYDGVPAINLNQ